MATRAHDEDDDTDEGTDLDDPQSHTRQKKRSDELELIMAELRGRARGLSGDELEVEIQHFIGRLIERNVRLAPAPMRDEARKKLRRMTEENPALQAMLASLRRAAVR